MRLENAITVFLAEWPAGGAAKTTVRSYRSCLEWLCSFAGEAGAVNLEDFTPSLVRRAVLEKMDERHRRPLNYKGGEASAAQMVAAAKCLSVWLIKQGLAAPDLSKVVAPRVPTRIQPRLFPNEFITLETTVLRRLLSGKRRAPRAGVARDLALLNVLGETGLRAQECCRLTLEDVDLQRGEIFIHAKGKKERVLSIVGPPEDADRWRVVRLVEDWLDVRQGLHRTDSHRHVWTSIRGNPLTPDELRKLLARMCLDAGMPASRPPHAFRRYVFTEHYRERPGALPKLVARMGWSERAAPRMTDIYIRGAELEFARDPLPLLSSRARDRADGDPKVPSASGIPRPIVKRGVGPPRVNVYDAPPPSRLGKEGERAASKPAKGLRSNGTR